MSQSSENRCICARYGWDGDCICTLPPISQAPPVIYRRYCPYCVKELGDHHTVSCPTKKSGVDYRDVIRYEYQLIGPA